MKGVNIQPDVSYGQIMQAMILLGSIFLIYMNVVRQQDNHELRIAAIEEAQKVDRETLGRIAENVSAIRQDMTIVKYRIDQHPGQETKPAR